MDCFPDDGLRYCESFNSKLRYELLNSEIFYSLTDARVVIEAWRVHYNTVRPTRLWATNHLRQRPFTGRESQIDHLPRQHLPWHRGRSCIKTEIGLHHRGRPGPASSSTCL